MNRIVVALVLVVGLTACGGGPSQEQLAQFCKAYSRAPEVLAENEAAQTSNSPAELERVLEALNEVRADIAANAPGNLKDDFKAMERFSSLSEDDQFKPAERKKRDEAQERIDAYANEECRL